ncbi:hypothetical protein [uncultured Flavobacterium sp.]|uniref:hypothetical protein n=1 Tax=uncultured Flavobacterium sp. TaxID=165435 RepID=UPI0030EC9443|tara:strand:- start:1424 stop:1873 length:450 start_codon:yes stop_codon:yes gene_type:complete
MKNIAIYLILVTSILTSCSPLKSIKSEYKLIRTSSSGISANEVGNGKVLIFNGSGMNHKIDDTSRLNIWINGNALGQLNANEYAVLYLLPGTYNFILQHKDVGNFESTHIVEITKETIFIKVKPTITSNKIEIVTNMPEELRWYNNILQ